MLGRAVAVGSAALASTGGLIAEVPRALVYQFSHRGLSGALLEDRAQQLPGGRVDLQAVVVLHADRREVGGWVGVEWDGLTDGNNLGGNCKQGAGWWVRPEFLELADNQSLPAEMPANPGTILGRLAEIRRRREEEIRRRFIESRRGEDRTRKAKLRYNPETGRLESR